MTLRADIDKAITKIQERIDAIDEQIAVLVCDMPGDPGVVVWPRDLEDAIDRAHDERAQAEKQLALLNRLRPQVA